MTNTNSNNVSVIDLSTNTITATVPVGDGPFGIAITLAQIEALVVTAKTGHDRFLTQIDLFNRITWTAPVDIPTAYEVYVDGILLATLPGSVYKYIDHNKRQGETNIYTIIALDGTDEIAVGSVTVTTN